MESKLIPCKNCRVIPAKPVFHIHGRIGVGTCYAIKCNRCGRYVYADVKTETDAGHEDAKKKSIEIWNEVNANEHKAD